MEYYNHSHTQTDNFSISRTGKLFGFYSSGIKKQLLTYLICSIILSLLLLIPATDDIRTGFFSMTWMIIQWMWYLSPLLLTKKGYCNGIDTLLPLKASEKLAFFILYFVIIIPLSLYILPLLAELYIIRSESQPTTVFMKLIYFQLHPSWVIRSINYLSAVLSVTVCLYYIVKSRHNKALYGIISAFICQIGLGILGAIVGGYQEMATGLEDGWNGMTADPKIVGKMQVDTEESLKTVYELLQPSAATLTVIGILIMVNIIFYLLLYKRLRKPTVINGI
ncbi:MAG: hypothetical protein K2J15_04945 [Muribaculaceae bacterium]|nr:hypothetical protein [Muribaculaceae bacterium]